MLPRPRHPQKSIPLIRTFKRGIQRFTSTSGTGYQSHQSKTIEKKISNLLSKLTHFFSLLRTVQSGRIPFRGSVAYYISLVTVLKELEIKAT